MKVFFTEIYQDELGRDVYKCSATGAIKLVSQAQGGFKIESTSYNAALEVALAQLEDEPQSFPLVLDLREFESDQLVAL